MDGYMMPSETAAIATKVFMDDLRLRGGFRELIDSIKDWPEIQQAMQNKVERALVAAVTLPKETQGEILELL